MIRTTKLTIKLLNQNAHYTRKNTVGLFNSNVNNDYRTHVKLSANCGLAHTHRQLNTCSIIVIIMQNDRLFFGGGYRDFSNTLCNLHAFIFRFPASEERTEAWNNSLRALGVVPKKEAISFVCSDHFKEEDYAPLSRKRKLKQDAVPSILGAGIVEVRNII